MSKLTKKAMEIIMKNTTDDHKVMAALEGPGGDHKDYLHVWPRDSFFVALELKNFNRSLAEDIVRGVVKLPTDNGLFYQRYELNGIPDDRAWCNGDGNRQLDQDALRFVVLAEFPGIRTDIKEIKKNYESFLDQIKQKKTVTDVWEQKNGYFFYTSTAIIWGLKSAEKILPESKEKHKKILDEIVKSLDSFFDKKLNSFVKTPSEKIIDLEIILGLNILFQYGNGIFASRQRLEKVVSTLKAVEKEIAVKIGDVKVPIRYKEDFWNGEKVGPNGSGRPWPMGIAFISQAYSYLVKAALSIREFGIAEEALEDAYRWLSYLKNTPNIEQFPEQIDFDGSVPQQVARPLTWCAAELLKAERLFSEAKAVLEEVDSVNLRMISKNLILNPSSLN